ncbi:helix-turn-helix domain-containing protein [Desmospora activa]|uniref:Tetratricopeptide repeat protein n=1 Tax=Desmospora activa DSM 45169 TaxID=1121389 RepID=A0A2T4ZBC1_9BACL|nr:tetratricopeptide repeat protein [Desmospora activa]PTM59181.1 tetratricopeptide repeat protein [Desmospora activa DSM 45169]
MIEDPKKIGEILRRVRKEKNLRLEDLADDHISPATISNIERGVAHVKLEKTHYLMGKLDLSMEDLPVYMQEYKVEQDEALVRLYSIECNIDSGKTGDALERLKEMRVPDGHPLAPSVYFLIGKCHRSAKRWKKAESNFQNAIRLASSTGDPYNIEAAAFNELAVVMFFENNYEQALSFINSGLDVFNDNGERQEYRRILEINKVAFLEKMGRIPQAIKLIDELWENRKWIRNFHALTLLYEIRTILFRKTQLHREAVECALEGIEIARMNRHFDRVFDLWSALGTTYLEMNKYDMAKHAFQTALDHLHILDHPHPVVDVYSQLGSLFMEERDYTTAMDYIRKGVNTAREVKEKVSLSKALIVLGKCQIAQDQYREATVALQEAVALTEELGRREELREAVLHLTRAWQSVDENKYRISLERLYKIELELTQKEIASYALY